MKRIVEVCCGSYEDALSSYYGNADRIELNSALALGGLTPSLASLVLTKKNTSLNVICMVRPRAAGFCYNLIEKDVMFSDAELFLKNGCDGIAFGFLLQDRSIDVDSTKKMVDLIHQYNGEAVFHRAFDCVKDPDIAIQQLIEIRVDRILTSGLQHTAVEGKDLIKDLQKRYGNKIQILAGSGVNSSNALDLMNYTGIYQVHSSCKSWANDPTTYGQFVDYAYTGDVNKDFDIVSKNIVEELVMSVRDR